jgi:rsbT co-antagonist protein RsbR
MAQATALAQLISKNQQQILEQWISLQKSSTTSRTDLLKERELREQSRDFLQNFSAAILNDSENTEGPAWKPVKEMLAGL